MKFFSKIIGKWNLISIKFLFALSFCIPFFVMLLVYIKMGIAPFGEKSILIMDMSEQYVTFFSELKNIVNGQSSIFFSWSKTFGGNFTGDFSYYISSPFSLFTLFFNNLNLPIALLWLTCIKIGFAGLALMIYFKYSFEKCGIVTLTLSICYALMSYSCVYSLSIMWLDGLIWLPFILLGIEMLLKGKFPWLLTVSLSIMFISNYYISYMIGLFCVFYFLLRYFGEKREYIASLKYFLFFALSVLLAVGMAAWLLIPAGINLLDGKLAYMNTSASQGVYFSLEEFLPKLLPDNYDSITTDGLPSVFCGTFVLFFGGLYFFNWKVKYRERFISFIILAFLTYSFISKQLDFIWHAFQYPNWFPFRNAFLYSFFLIFLAFRSIYAIPWETILKKISKWKMAKSIVLYTLLTLLITLQTLQMYKNSKSMIQGLDNQFQYQTIASYQDFYNRLVPLVEAVEDEESFFRMEKNFERTKNDAMTFGYKGVTHYSSLFNESVNQFTKKIGFAQSWMWNSYFGNTPLTDMLFNMRYIMSEKNMPEYYNLIDQNESVSLYENPYTLPVAYMANDVSKIEGSYFEAQNQMMNAISNCNYNYFENCVNKYIGENKYSFIASKKAPYFLKKSSQVNSWGNVYVNDVRVGDFYSGETDCILYVGEYNVGDQVTLYIEGDAAVNGLEIVSLDIEKLVEVYEIIDKGGLEVEEYGAQFINGFVEAASDGIMMTSIPYDKGFRVYVDGKAVETDKAFETFLCFRVPKGEHEIDIKYTAPGAKVGALITIFSVLLGIGIIMLRIYRRKETVNNEES